MDLLIFESKHGAVKNCKNSISVPIGKYYGILEGEQVIVSDLKGAGDLNAYGCYGEFLQRREPRISMECFESNVHQQQQQERLAKSWKRLWPKDNTLRLGMEEAMYLNAEVRVLQLFAGNGQEYAPNVLWKAFYDRYGIRFVKRYATYRYFRRQGWVVRAGLHCGVDFMLYRDGPEYYHSSAGVRIVSTRSRCDASAFIALNRELNGIKKTLIEVTVVIPEDCNIQSIESIYCISITHTTAVTWKTSNDR